MALTPEQQSELEKTFAANRAYQESLLTDQVPGRAEVKVALVQGGDDPPLFSPEAQAEIQGARSALRDAGIDAAAPIMVMDSPGAGGGFVGEFIIPLANVGAPAVAAIVGAWLHGKLGRKVRIEFYADGTVKKVEAPTVEGVTALIEGARVSAQPRPVRKAK